MGYGLGLLLVAALLCVAAPARGQCGAALSECRTCHEVRAEKPVLAGPSPWHRDHAFADFCALCHGGDPKAKDAASAHAGVASPLAEPAATCGGCHGRDAPVLAERYERARAAAPPTPLATEPPSPPAPSRSAPRWNDIALTGLVLVVGAAGAAYVRRNERRLRGGRA